MREFNLLEGGIQDNFLKSRAKIQIFAGGFGNGKTTGAVAKILQLCTDYPGANILMARETYPKLNDTLRKEFIDWCPEHWIKQFPMSANSSNTCTLHNGTTLNFRYIQQQGRNEQSTTSNLLSATYDAVLVDQMEDPGITHKDFLDLIGRLRGSAPYRGDDPTMPSSGPRWFIMTLNPTRNWVYKKIIAPLHLYKKAGVITDDLLCVRDTNGVPVRDDDGNVIVLVDLVEGGTEANQHNLPKDFIQTMASTYTGTMKARFLKGEWAAYEGLVYPMFNQVVHCVEEQDIKHYLDRLDEKNFDIEWVEGYDHGIASPSCYSLGFVDPAGSVVIVDGFYEKEFPIESQFSRIDKIRRKWAGESRAILADPDVFRRRGARGEVVADLFWSEANITLQKGDNDITNGIAKIGGYLLPIQAQINPFTFDTPAPSLYFNSNLTWFADEFGTYFWKQSSNGERTDVPTDSNDHAMDCLKYLFTHRPQASKLRPRDPRAAPRYLSWHEQDALSQHRGRVHGSR